MNNIVFDLEGRCLKVKAWIVVTDQMCAPLDKVIYRVTIKEIDTFNVVLKRNY